MRTPFRYAESWPGALIALALAVGSALLLAQLMMAPPAREMRDMAVYLTISGAGSMSLVWLGLRLAGDSSGLTLRARTFVGASIGSGVALLNLLVIARLMFVSTSHDLKLLAALLMFSAVVTVCFTFWVANAVSNRVATVGGGIRGLAAGDYATRVPIVGRDEIAGLAAVVNTLAGRLEDATRQRDALDRERRDLTAAISHDLRTPLASIRAMVDALDDHVVEDPDEVTRYYCVMRREIERLSRMIDDLFELARLDAGALQLDRRPLALQEVAAEVVDAMTPQARAKGVELALRIESQPAPLSLDGGRIERAVANLVRNAIEHTPAGGRIDVSVGAPNGAVELHVRDNGEGIDAADLMQIWERFYRGDKSRNRATAPMDGAGLGLAIVRGIVEAHGGSVDARSEIGAGSTFTLRLPL
jgi:signal transduction histidine kinase